MAATQQLLGLKFSSFMVMGESGVDGGEEPVLLSLGDLQDWGLGNLDEPLLLGPVLRGLPPVSAKLVGAVGLDNAALVGATIDAGGLREGR